MSLLPSLAYSKKPSIDQNKSSTKGHVLHGSVFVCGEGGQGPRLRVFVCLNLELTDLARLNISDLPAPCPTTPQGWSYRCVPPLTFARELGI